MPTAATFATQVFRPCDQHEAWREWFRPILEVIPKENAEKGFAAENRLWSMDGIAVSKVAAPPVRAVRTRAELRRDSVDHWVLRWARR